VIIFPITKDPNPRGVCGARDVQRTHVAEARVYKGRGKKIAGGGLMSFS
jgi:hypothetical protein